MRVIRLDLIAFGPFTNTTLDFSDAHGGLQIVYGPNEAGKSSCLRALRQWLYGIPHNSTDRFVHTSSNLRIGGLLEHSSGEQLAFIRRWGREKTIRAFDDEQRVLDPAVVARFLGNVDSEIFAQRFGIDHQELVRGGAAIASGGGELGDILFVAGAGLADVRQIQAALEKEMSQLFTPSGRNPRINAALNKYAEVRERIKKSQLPTSKWLELDRALRDYAERLHQIDRQLVDARSQNNRLTRISQAISPLARRRQLLAELETVADARLLPADFPDQRAAATTQLNQARQAAEKASREIARLEQLIASINLPTKLLEHRATITKLHTDLGKIQKAAVDRQRIVAEIRARSDQAERLLDELGREPDLASLETMRVPLAQRQRIQELAAEFKAIRERQKSTEKAHRKLCRDIERLEAARWTVENELDTNGLRRAVRSAQRHGELTRQIAEIRAELTEWEADAAADLQTLPLFQGSLDQLQRLRPPLEETIERFEQQWTTWESAVQTRTLAIEEGIRAARQLEQRLEAIRLDRDVPSEDDLQQARSIRDHGWRLVERCWRDPQSADAGEIAAFVEQNAPGGDLAEAFRTCVARADAIADRLRREADRVSEKARLVADLREQQQHVTDDQEKLKGAQRQFAELQAAWRAEWAALGIEPLEPREMKAWVRRHSALADRARHIEKHRLRAEQLLNLANQLRNELVDELLRVGRAKPPTSMDLNGVIEICQTTIEEIEETIRRRKEVEKELAKLKRELEDAEQELAVATREYDEWQRHWQEALQVLGLGVSAAPADAHAVLESLTNLHNLVDKNRDDNRRVEGIDRDRKMFDADVARLLFDLGMEISMPAESAVVELQLRLEEASRNQAKLEQWELQLQNQLAERAQAQTEMERCQALIASLCQQAGVATADELILAEQRSTARRTIEQQLRAIQERLNELAAGEEVAAFLEEVAAYQADALEAELGRCSDEIKQLEAEKTEVNQAVGSLRNELSHMNGSAAAAEAQEEAERLLASIRDDAEQYIRLRLSSAVLRRAIERFREASQGPILDRAGQLFCQLTLGSFVGLRADYSDAGHPMLVGVRPNSSQTVSVGGMSDGTCDQLYLALRLALLEAYLQDHEPLPLILDDVLIRFDDARSAAALGVLSQLAERTQVIFFTHHQRLVDLAREHLHPSQFSVYELNHRQQEPSVVLHNESA